MDVAVVGTGDRALSVVLVLDLHAGELGDVDILSEVLSRSHPLLHCHVQLESTVGLVLTVGKAGTLLGGLRRRHELVIGAITVALRKEERRQGVLEERLFLLARVLSPVRHY